MNRTVVLGAGYGGVACVQELESIPNFDPEIVWIDMNDYHLVQHEIHRIIYDVSVRDTLTIPVEEIKDGSTRFIQASVEGFDFSEKQVTVVEKRNSEREEREIGYDYLVVALGQKTNLHGIPGVEEYAFTLKSLNDALDIREALEELLRKDGKKRVVVGGAGLSGIQATGEIADFLNSRLSLSDYSVTLVETLSDIMPREGGSRFRRAIRKELRSRGVMTLTNSPVVEVTQDEIYIEGRDPLPYDVFLWTGGLTSHDFECDEELKRGERDAFRVRSTLESVDFDDVFVVGDAAYVKDVSDRKAPATAWAAKDEARVAARNVKRKMKDQELEKFRLRKPGTLVSVGRDAVGEINGRVVTGLAAKTMKRGAAVRHISSVGGASRGIESAFEGL
ncbi:MAG: FAD-dependent oxidoreductase [Halobacteria archaeon]|nr:FAD-dependent oxidoreductase [Halobacteria archaeon]